MTDETAPHRISKARDGRTRTDTARGRSRKRRVGLRVLGAAFAAFAVLALLGVLDAWTAIGTRPSGARLERMNRSSQFRGGKFVDTVPRVDPEIWKATWRWLGGAEHSQPSEPLPVLLRSAREFVVPPDGLRITWFGHSSLLVEIEGRRILIDPVFSERCSPSKFVGPRRFHAVPIAIESLPPLDAVLISHDHYDHLDYASVEHLRTRGVPFVVPLGVGAHLEYWGFDAGRIRELDWWEETTISGLRFVATPARHFSGRGLGADRTLWAGWVVLGASKRVYYSGDTAMFEGFAQIGKRFGPFDAAMIEVGAYDAMWADVHLGPEQAIEAHRAAAGGLLFPVHWGTFDLALHSWVEPAERVLVAAKAAGVRLVTPKPGESIDVVTPPPPNRWWPALPWKTAAQAPVRSSGAF